MSTYTLDEEIPMFPLPPALAEVLPSTHLRAALEHLCSAVAVISHNLTNLDSNAKAGTQNAFGDNQLEVDLHTDHAVFTYLRASGVCAIASSEEQPKEIDMGCQCDDADAVSVGFDPLDGSSIVDANFAVGSIFGVWPGRGLVGRTGREQVGALVAQYGPRTTVALAVAAAGTTDGAPRVLELTLRDQRWEITRERLSIAPQGKVFAPGNLRAISDNIAYKALVDHYLASRYTLRYSGGMVPDIYHILLKGKGVMTNVASASAQHKLRLLYECAPIALVVELAGGGSCAAPEPGADGTQLPTSLLDVPISDLDRRVGCCYGSTEEVERFKTMLF